MTAKQNKNSKKQNRVSKAAGTPVDESKTKPATGLRAQDQLDAKKSVDVSKVATALNAGQPLTFPKCCNAVRVTIGGKQTVVVKADAGTLKGTGVEKTEFGSIKYDAKKRPLRETFQAVSNAVSQAEPTPKKSTEPAATGYPKGTLRETLLLAGAKPFKSNEELVERIGTKTFNAEQIIRCLAVVSDDKNRFNKGVSVLQKTADGTMMMLVSLKK